MIPLRPRSQQTLFTERAQQLLESACSAIAQGQLCSDMTVLITEGGGLHFCPGSDWPLDSLARERNAQAAYRVTSHRGVVRVEGQQGPVTCVLTSYASVSPKILLG